jgi:hypothetical protein
MKQFTYSGLAILIGALVCRQTLAIELGDFGQYPRGVTIGDPVAAVLPPGFYFENVTVVAPELQGYGQFHGIKSDVAADIPIFIWSTGWPFLGANLSMYFSKPGYYLTVWNSATPGPPFPGAIFYPELSNTWITPIALSWNLGSGWFSNVGFALHVPDGSSYNNSTNPDYWTYEPHAAITYLANGWNLTSNFTYDVNTASAGHTGVFAGTPLAAFGFGYRSGDQAFLDLTATKTINNWEIGPVAYFMWQTTPDRPGGGYSCAALAATTRSLVTCGRATDYAIGGLIGYDFGPVALKLFLTDSVYTRDNLGGLAVWTKLSFRLWGPDAPAPTANPFAHK